jgi:hypothetical protein
MIYWDIQVSENGFLLDFPDETVLRASVCDGLYAPTVRQAFINALIDVPVFRVITANGESFLSEDQKLGDIMMWGWVRVFSERAKTLAISLGCMDCDFLRCTLTINQDQSFFMFLPAKYYDVVDADQTVFLRRIPVAGKVPILGHILDLVLKNDCSNLPPCFHPLMQGYKQALGELFVSDAFKVAWETMGLSAAKFRNLNRQASNQIA